MPKIGSTQPSTNRVEISPANFRPAKAYRDQVGGKEVVVNIVPDDPVPCEKLRNTAHFSHSPANVRKYNAYRKNLFVVRLTEELKKLKTQSTVVMDEKKESSESSHEETPKRSPNFEEDPEDSFDRTEEATLISSDYSPAIVAMESENLSAEFTRDEPQHDAGQVAIERKGADAASRSMADEMLQKAAKNGVARTLALRLKSMNDKVTPNQGQRSTD